MQRKEEKKKLRSKITTRTLLITLSLFVMLIMLACILLYGSYHMNVLSRQILDSAKTSLSVDQNMLDISLEKNAQMINILLSDNGYIYYPEEIKKEKEIVYKYTQLYNHCAKYTAQLELCDGVFVYDSYFDRWAVSGSSDSIFLQNGIRELVNAYKDKLDAPWIMAEVEKKECLIHIQKNSDIIIGFWVSTDSLKKITDMELTAYGENAHLLVESYKKTDEENKDFSDKEYLEVFAVSRLHAFQLHALIPKDDIYKNVSVLKWMLVLISFIFLLLIAAQYVTTNHYVLKPLQLLKEAMIRIKNGDLSSRLNPSSVNPDFGEVYEALNNMSDELTKLKIDVYEERIKKQKFELEFLRMQIKPHFFLNCLNIIYSLVNAGRYSLIQTMVVRLSDYFRYIFRTTDSFVNVEKELEHVENYLQIQAVRYPNRFTYKIRRDTDTKNIIIPPMMIQTFVENSIKYGFSNPIRDQLKIGIRVLEEEEIYSITIRDNGKGFPPEVLKKLQEKSSLEDENGNHIGIQNTLKRLELLYQNRAIVEFENEEGAQVHIYLPKHQVEKLL